MKHTLNETGGRLVIALEGNFIFSDHAAFQSVLERLHQQAVKDCVFDLAGLDFIDSTGLGMLVLANDVCERSGFFLRLINAHGQVRAVLERAEFGTIMTVE
ncbi:HptB-dependent secretion and biofilm anti anti-sigma factor [uncultured Gammaproteobacteria bacterium]